MVDENLHRICSGGDTWDSKLFPDPVSKEGGAQPWARLSGDLHKWPLITCCSDAAEN